MMLEQINRRLQRLLEARNRRLAVVPPPNADEVETTPLMAEIIKPPKAGEQGTTIAIRAPKSLYDRLKVQMERHGLSSIKQTVYVAVQAGLAVLEMED